MFRCQVLTAGVLSLGLLVAGCGGSSDAGHAGNGGNGPPGGAGGQSVAGGSGGSTATGGSGNVSGVAGQKETAGSGGSATGGSATGGSATGGSATGGSATGGSATGGSATGRGGTGGSAGGATGGDQYPVPSQPPADEDGSQLWLRYPKVSLPNRLTEYQGALTHVVKAGSSATLQAAQSELVKGLGGLLGATVPTADAPTGNGAVVLGTTLSSPIISGLSIASRLSAVGSEGYLVETADIGGKAAIVIAGNTDVGVLRGAFALLRHLQCHRSLQGLSLSGAPKIKRRLLNHWDNLDGTVERGYAGKSIWWPSGTTQHWVDYARANASIGINGTVLNNVNSNAQIMTASNLTKVKAIADAVRPYGIAVYLSARFSAPQEIGNLSTSDPNDSGVKSWWASKVTEIYQAIPDFGGFLVKANSEGQPGPQTYNRTHADGAKMLSDALGSKGGVVLWRAFVYTDNGMDRIRQAYDEFKPLDGKFGANALVQVKNGPLDFQPREPFSPLFGAMPSTPLSLELQITKEYLGEDTHLAYLGPLFEEVLKSDTYAKGAGSTVARVIDGTVHGYANSAISGVSNVGGDANWTGSHFNQANWYAFGRMAWDPDVTAKSVADDWIRQTLSNDPVVVAPVTEMMMASRENLVNYMTPLGLAHIMGTDDHYGPGPWINNLSTANWNPFYYHKADATGIGFDRTSAGSNAVSQYAATVRDKLASKTTVPDELLLFFQRMKWDDKLASTGRTVWEELVHRYSTGVDAVQVMRDQWTMVQGRVDAKRYKDVGDFLQRQHYEARWWRDACLSYFSSVNSKAIPTGYAAPAMSLSAYKSLETSCPSDATKPRCSSVYTGTPSPTITK